jgi:hypothetical protein
MIIQAGDVQILHTHKQIQIIMFSSIKSTYYTKFNNFVLRCAGTGVKIIRLNAAAQTLDTGQRDIFGMCSLPLKEITEIFE